MSFFSIRARSRKRFGRRRGARPCPDPEAVFRSFVRALERLRSPSGEACGPRGGAPANVGALREKA